MRNNDSPCNETLQSMFIQFVDSIIENVITFGINANRFVRPSPHLLSFCVCTLIEMSIAQGGNYAK